MLRVDSTRTEASYFRTTAFTSAISETSDYSKLSHSIVCFPEKVYSRTLQIEASNLHEELRYLSLV